MKKNRNIINNYNKLLKYSIDKIKIIKFSITYKSDISELTSSLFTKEHLKNTLDELQQKISSLTMKNNQLTSYQYQVENSGGKVQKKQLSDMKGKSIEVVMIKDLEQDNGLLRDEIVKLNK